MESLYKRFICFIRSFYGITLLLFFSWLVFFDSNDLFSQFRLSAKEKDLLETRNFYVEKIEGVKSDRQALLNSDELLEKIAREKYFMKKDNEDVFVVVEKE